MSQTQGSLALEKPKVITIAASQSLETRKLRMAAYVRVSSASEEQENSFAAQMRHYTACIAANTAWELADIYADEAVTGTSVEKREDFKRLLADCRRGLVDKVLTKSISRFARNVTECLVAIRELKALGVGVVFEENGIDTSHMSGEMMTAILASKAQDESETISGNVRWGYQRRMKAGTAAPTAAPYGYAVVNKQLKIVDAQAKVIRRIFDNYLAGISSAEIAAALSHENIPTKRGNTVWGATSIREIISNEKYVGDVLWQKHYTTDTFPYQCKPNKGERPQYYIADGHEAIITRETFEMAQTLRGIRGAKIETKLSAVESPCWHKVYCGHCGAICRRIIIRQINYWVCRTHVTNAAACPITQIPEAEINAAFLRLYHKLKHEGRPILEEVPSRLQMIREKELLWSVEVVALNQKICEITSQNQALALMKLGEGNVDSDFFISQGNRLAEELRLVKLEKERLLESKADDAIPKTRELLELLDSAPEEMEEFDPSWFEELIEKVVVENSTRLHFRLKNGLELPETIERTVR